MYWQRIFYTIIWIIFYLFLGVESGISQDFTTKEFPEITEKNQNDYFSQVNFEFNREKPLVNFSSDSIKKSISAINYYWWMIIAGEKSREMKKNLFYQLEGSKQEFTETRNDLALIFLLSYELRVHYYYNEVFSALISLNKINGRLHSYRKTQGLFENEYFLLLKSLVDYMNAYINEKYPFYYTLFIRQSCIDKKYSIDQLKKLASSKNSIVSTESNYFLMKIYFDNEQDFISAEKYARTLAINYPGNFIFSYYYVRILKENHKLFQAQVEKKRILKHTINNSKLTEDQSNYCKLLFQDVLSD